MNFVEMINAHGRTMPEKAPPIAVAHPHFGSLGVCAPGKGLVPPKGRWASTKAILRDADRRTVRVLRTFEDHAPKFALAALTGLIVRDPWALPIVFGAISNYDGIVSARGSGALQDVWMQMSATLTAVSGVWMDLMNFTTPITPMTAPTIVAYLNSSTAGGVLDAASNGSWLTNPAGSNKKYIVSMGLSTTSLVGFSLAMLYDCLWAGQYLITANATLNPTSDVVVTRWSSAVAGNAEYAGGNMIQCCLAATLTHTGAATVTITYTDVPNGAGRVTAGITPATGPLIPRIVFNTLYNSATVVPSTPFMSFSNSGSAGAKNFEQIVVSGGTVSSGTINAKIVRPLLIMPFIAANSYIEQDTTLNIGNMMELHNVSQVCGCLAWNLLCGAGTTATTISALMRTVEG